MSTAVILAGGHSRRMQRDKMALPFGNASLLAGAVARFSERFDTVYLSVAEEGKYPELQVKRLVDIYKGCGPLGGLHAALLSAQEEGVFLVAADLPYSDPAVALRLMTLCGDQDAAITADSSGRFEPLFGYYRKTMLPQVEEALRTGNNKVTALLRQVRLRIVEPAELGPLWHDKLLLNVNYPEDYERLCQADG